MSLVRSKQRSAGWALFAQPGVALAVARGLGLDRPFLHSWRVELVHPITGETLRVEEPLPADLAEALVRARDDLRP